MATVAPLMEFWTAYVDLEHMVFWWSQSWDMGPSAPLYFGGHIYRDLYPFLGRGDRQFIQDMLTCRERFPLRLLFQAGRGPIVLGNPSPPNDMGETPSSGGA